jgi:hypothetical protein
MKRKPSMIEVQRWVVGRLVRLRPLATRAAALAPSERQRLLTFVTIDLHNTCANFLRSYYLSSTTGAWLTTGQRVTSQGFTSQHDALTFAMHTTGRSHGSGPWRRRDEPAWHDTTMFIRLVNAAKCSNAAGVNAAWSIGTGALADLTRARHFFAHRNEETAARLRSIGVTARLGRLSDPADVLVSVPPGRPQVLLEDWFDDLHTVFMLMPV